MDNSQAFWDETNCLLATKLADQEAAMRECMSNRDNYTIDEVRRVVAYHETNMGMNSNGAKVARAILAERLAEVEAETASKAPTYARDIAGLLAASGPQELHALRRECITQTIGYTENGFTQAILDMVIAGVLEQDQDDKAFELVASQSDLEAMYRQKALAVYADGSDDDIEVAEDARVSINEDGAWIAAAVWIGKHAL